MLAPDRAVACDVDEILRTNKGPVNDDIQRIIQTARSDHGIVCSMITAAPFSHLPPMAMDFAFAESGGIFKTREGAINIRRDVRTIIHAVNDILDIETIDGPATVCGERVIVEGIRYCSLTFLTGRPPHYTPRPTGSLAVIEQFIQKHCIQEKQLPICLIPGIHKAYEWLDVVPRAITKEMTITWFYQTYRPRQFLYLGDGRNDLAAMELPFVIPVAFANSIAEIKDVAMDHGVYVPLHAVTENGTYTFFKALCNGSLHQFPIIL